MSRPALAGYFFQEIDMKDFLKIFSVVFTFSLILGLFFALLVRSLSGVL